MEIKNAYANGIKNGLPNQSINTISTIEAAVCNKLEIFIKKTK